MSEKMAEKTPSADASQPKTEAKASEFRQPGFRHVRTTNLFRAVNPELFMKPNKVTMAAGLFVFSSCVAYIAYWNATMENKKEKYMALREDGKMEKRERTSRWD